MYFVKQTMMMMIQAFDLYLHREGPSLGGAFTRVLHRGPALAFDRAIHVVMSEMYPGGGACCPPHPPASRGAPPPGPRVIVGLRPPRYMVFLNTTAAGL